MYLCVFYHRLHNLHQISIVQVRSLNNSIKGQLHWRRENRTCVSLKLHFQYLAAALDPHTTLVLGPQHISYNNTEVLYTTMHLPTRFSRRLV